MHAFVSPDNPRIVIPIVAGVGNALMAVPMVRQLKRAIPGARITVIARIAAMGEAYRRMPEVDEVLVTGNGWRGILRKIRWTRRRKADVYLVPFPSNRWQYNVLALLSGARTRIMHRFPVGSWRALGFVRARRVPAVRGIHDVPQNLHLLEAMGIEPRLDEAPRFIVADTDRARAAELLQRADVDELTAFVALHAGSGRTVLGRAKRWPPGKWAQLLAKFRRQFSHHVVLLEGPDEAGVGEEILRECEADVTNLSVVRLTGPLGDWGRGGRARAGAAVHGLRLRFGAPRQRRGHEGRDDLRARRSGPGLSVRESRSGRERQQRLLAVLSLSVADAAPDAAVSRPVLRERDSSG
jgi:ADP-heptose:LPS heptosyltransferase